VRLVVAIAAAVILTAAVGGQSPVSGKSFVPGRLWDGKTPAKFEKMPVLSVIRPLDAVICPRSTPPSPPSEELVLKRSPALAAAKNGPLPEMFAPIEPDTLTLIV